MKKHSKKGPGKRKRNRSKETKIVNENDTNQYLSKQLEEGINE